MGRTLTMPVARKYVPAMQRARYIGIYGGRGSAKSQFFGRKAIQRCIQEPTRGVCVREFQTSLAQSVKRLLEDVIREHGYEGPRSDQFQIMNNQIVAPNEGVLIFQGMQSHTADSVKSLEGFDFAWVEEAQSLSQRSLDLLRPTLRKPGSELWFSWNPSKPTDPVDVLLRGPVPPPNSIVIESTYEDNPWFPDVLREEMEYDKARDYEKYEHIWGGKYETHSEARVFKNWKEDEFDVPEDTIFYMGGDWGFSVDPSVLVAMFLKKKTPGTPERDTLFIAHEVYKIGCEIDHLPMLFDSLVCRCGWVSEANWVPFATCNHPEHGIARKWKIVVDSARPETISYMQRHGYPKMEAAIKGKDSVKEGVIFLQGMDIVVHRRCRHSLDEFKSYSYVQDKLTGMVTPILEDKKNHVIDSARYGVEPIRKPRKGATW